MPQFNIGKGKLVTLHEEPDYFYYRSWGERKYVDNWTFSQRKLFASPLCTAIFMVCLILQNGY